MRARAVVWRLAAALMLATPAAAEPALQRGVNLSHWLQYGGGQPVAAEDMAMLRDAGFDHVRLPVDPAFLGWTPERPGEIPQAERLRDAIGLVVAAGLDVILDLHPDEAFKQKVEDDETLEPAMVALWRALAREAAAFPPERVAFELLNEPQYYRAPARWGRFQARLAEAARQAAPGRLLLLSGPEGGSVAALTRSPPAMAGAAYVFHFYLPYAFTHQGAEWMAADPHTAAADIRGLPWPARAVSALPEGRAAAEVARYRADDWDGARIRQSVEMAAAWGHWYGVRVVCTEFGVLRTHAPPESRYGWIGDARRAFETLGLGWTVWDYADVFGIAAGQPRRLDDDARQALGLGRERGQ